MHALDALFTTYALFAKAAALPSEVLLTKEGEATLGDRRATSPNPERVASSGPILRKYLIVRDDFATTHNRIRVIVFSSELQHKDLVPLKCDAISAGSFGIINGKVFLTDLGSETLKLASHPKDAALIQSLFSES
jgi:hypothetical protein